MDPANSTMATFTINVSKAEDTQSSPIIRDKFTGASLNWPEALKAYGALWPLHIYGFSVLFSILCIWSIVYAVKAYRRKNVPSRGCYIALHLMVAFCTFGRLFYLIANGYGYTKRVPDIVAYIPKFAMFPCITSCFILLFTIFLRITKVKVVARSILKIRIVIAIVSINFLFGYTADILAVTLTRGMYFMFMCDSYFVTWGTIFSTLYLYVFSRVYTNVVVNRRKLNEISSKDDVTGSKAAKLDTEIPLAGKIMLASAFSFITIAVLNIYRLINLLVNLSEETLPPADPWYWWSYNTAIRALEVIMNATISFVASLPFYR